jgi:spermidine synthase
VKRSNLIDHTLAPDGKTISLHEHDGSYFIRVDGNPLMSTRQHASEERLAELACAHVAGVRGARVLIGGLGFGFTLRAALALLAADATVVVAELLSAVIEWNRNAAFGLAADAMADPRVTVVQRDVGEVIRAARGEFDSILLDVDNGPVAMSTPGNERLYDEAGLRQARAALRSGGCVAVWSAAADQAFVKRMQQAGFAVEVKGSRARGNAGARHTIFLGRVVGHFDAGTQRR